MTMLTNECLYVMIITGLYGIPTSCQNLSGVKRLIKDKELDYDRSVRPVTNQSTPITVYIEFNLLSITEVNEVQQTITMNAFFKLVWVDVQMSWNPNDYDGIYHFTVDSDRFWTPTLVLMNTNEKLEKIGDSWISVRYAANGIAMYYPGTISKATCSLDIRFYPWDRHTCFLLFNAWGYAPGEYDLQNVSSEVDTTLYYPNGAWDLTGSSVLSFEIPAVGSFYCVEFYIRRQPTYVIVNVILPVIILSLLNLMIYFIPAESGERMSFSITLLLAIAVFLTIVGDNLPKSSTPMAIFSYYLLSVLVISNCITLSVIYSLCLYHRDESKPIGGCWKGIVRVMKCKCNSRKRNDKYRYDNQVQNSDQAYDGERNSKVFKTRMNLSSEYQNRPFQWKMHVYRSPASVLPPHNGGVVSKSSSYKPTEMESDYEKYDDNNETEISWKNVSMAFDRMCFIWFLLILIASMSTTFGLIYVGLKQAVPSPQPPL